MFDQRDVYKYEAPAVGGERFADPLTVRRALLAGTSGRCWEWAREAKKLADDLAQVGDTPGEAADAQRAELSSRQAEVEGWLVGATMQAFGLSPLDSNTGFGCTETAALALLYDFLGWLEGKGGRSGS